MTKSIVLCADDYGQSLSISQAILELIKLKRITATSCLVNTPFWPEHAQWLLPFQNLIDIGLHINLTEGYALANPGQAFSPLKTLLFQAFWRKLDTRIIAAECRAQIERFIKYMGFLPKYLDGHQHVHQFPLVRQAVLQIYHEYLAEQKAYIRLVKSTNNITNSKKMLIAITGVKGLEYLLQKYAIPHNNSFAGIYAFKNAQKYAKFFPIFLDEVKERGIVMCHPGDFVNVNDSMAQARFYEFTYLKSEQFTLACTQKEVTLTRFFT